MARMSRSLNKATLIGNAGSVPEVRTTAKGSRVATVPLATSRRWTDADGVSRERTEWHRLVALDDLAQVLERNVRKGSRLFVEGRLEYRSWETPRGRRQHATEIVAEEILVLDPDSIPPAPVWPPAEAEPSAPSDAELPF